MRKFNFIFKKIVRDEKDLTGMIAYSLYKRNKIEVIEGKVEKSNSSISDADLKEFNEFSNTKSQIESYRDKAEKIIVDYSNVLFKNKLDEIENFYKKKAVLKFSHGVLQSILGSFFYTFLIAILFIILWSTQVGMEEMIEKIFQIDIVRK